MRKRITSIFSTTALIAAIAAIGTAGLAPVAAAKSGGKGAPLRSGSGTERAYVFEGTVSKNSSPEIRLDCGSSGYLESVDNWARGSLFDQLRIDTAGSGSHVFHTIPVADNLAEWGHWGSRLARGVHFNVTLSHGSAPEHYRITLYCVSDQSAAWVVAP